MAAVGVDGCKRGWVAVVLRDGQPPQAHVFAAISEVGVAVPDATALGIDIPIGLPAEGPRQADLAARRLLGPRRSSIFLTPVRPALVAASHAEASAISVDLTGAGISQQAFALRHKILEVEQWLPAAPCAVYEVHPEVCFAEMLGAPAPSSKKTWQGMVERRAALEAQGVELEAIDSQVGALVPADDLFDAAAAAWTARRVLAGSARSLPDPPELDDAGRPMAIWV